MMYESNTLNNLSLGKASLNGFEFALQYDSVFV